MSNNDNEHIPQNNNNNWGRQNSEKPNINENIDENNSFNNNDQSLQIEHENNKEYYKIQNNDLQQHVQRNLDKNLSFEDETKIVQNSAPTNINNDTNSSKVDEEYDEEYNEEYKTQYNDDQQQKYNNETLIKQDMPDQYDSGSYEVYDNYNPYADKQDNENNSFNNNHVWKENENYHDYTPYNKSDRYSSVSKTAKTLSLMALVFALGSFGLSGYHGIVHHNDNNDSPSFSKTIKSSGEKDSSSSSSVENDGSWTNIVDKVSDSVVSINISSAEQIGVGSGLVISDDGLILTNNHVVNAANDIFVTLNDGSVYNAEKIGTDPETDLAVLKLKNSPKNLVPVVFANSDDVNVGDSVLAMGNPLGLSQTATSGIVSAVKRPVVVKTDASGTTTATNAIQIDAAVNPGNSGGPLFNNKGEVIGVTSTIATLSNGELTENGVENTGGSIGLGFAITSNQAEKIAEELVNNGSVKHPWLGIYMQSKTVEFDNKTVFGANIAEIMENSPAEEAGLEPGDTIVEVDGQQIGSAEALTGYIREKSIDDNVKITYIRDGKQETKEIKLTGNKSSERVEF